MGFTRRNFIKFAVGGLGGTLLSPLPWKLIDDIAIWTQNWSWVPVPARGRFSTIRSVCTLCPGTCGIEVRKVGSRVVKIEGRKDYPVNRGAICPLGMAGQQILYNEGMRWKAPMKRVGPRGSRQWREISWDEAIEEVATRIKGLRERGNPEKLAAIDGNQPPSTMALLISRFLNAVGSPNYVSMPREEDTHAMVTFLMHGVSGSMGFDLENSDFILSFGCGLLDGWGAPGRMLKCWREWAQKRSRKGTYLVQIEARASNTASKADQWLAPFPGTEAALALGIAHVIIKERLYKAEFIDHHTFGFTDWCEASGVEHKGFSRIVLEKYPPQRVEDITGVKREVIIEVARKYALAEAPIALAGRGKGMLPGSLYEFMAIHALNALLGGINRRVGVLVTDGLPLAQWSDLELDPVAIHGLRRQRLDRAGTSRYPFTRSLIHRFAEAIDRAPGSPVDILLICSANPLYTAPHSKSLLKAMAKIPFIASFSPFMDETSLMADLILPDHTHLEKMVDIVSPPGIQYPLYALSKPLVEPIYRTRHSGDVIISLSQRIGGSVASSFQWPSFEEALKERVRGLYDSGKGGTSFNGSEPVSARSSFTSFWEEIKESGCWCDPSRPLGRCSDIFQTPSKKFEFFSTSIESALTAYSKGTSFDDSLTQLGIRTGGDEVYMPHYEEIRARADEEEYPLLLFPIELINVASGWIANPPTLNKTLFDHQVKGDDLFVEVNPKTASKYGLSEGSKALLRSPVGVLKVGIHLFDGAMPDVIFIPFGLGHRAYDRYIKGKGVNPHEIIDYVEDPVSGHPVWWHSRIKVVKI
jgi:anaerobic selenocysteine-containing dehydrogenase